MEEFACSAPRKLGVTIPFAQSFVTMRWCGLCLLGGACHTCSEWCHLPRTGGAPRPGLDQRPGPDSNGV